MTPCPCMQHARTGFPGSLTETYSSRQLSCTDGRAAMLTTLPAQSRLQEPVCTRKG
jgi:hypothetical protein